MLCNTLIAAALMCVLAIPTLAVAQNGRPPQPAPKQLPATQPPSVLPPATRPVNCAVSNIMKTKHETVKNAISNIR